MIEVTGLSKAFGTFTAVRDLSFAVRPGEVLGLVGPNGAGKTTTLRAIAGIIPPTTGQVRLAGHDLLTEPLQAKRMLAFFTDEPRLFDYLTVRQHLNFVARLYAVADHEAIARPLLEELEIADRLDSLPAELSRGMKQKLAIACGLLHAPQVLMFDEPLTGLDPLGIRRMKDSILKRAQAGAAIILSSHLLHSARGGVLARSDLEARREDRGRHARRDPRTLRQRRRQREPRGRLHPRDGRHRKLMRHTIAGALLYVRLTTAKGWVTSRLRRLKQPKYLVGAVIGVGYMYFFFFRHVFQNRASRPRPRRTRRPRRCRSCRKSRRRRCCW